MVLVPVSQNYRRDVVAILFEEIKIGDTDIHAIRSLLWKPHPSVEDQHLVAVTHGHTIHSKLADTAERDDLQNATHVGCFLDSP